MAFDHFEGRARYEDLFHFKIEFVKTQTSRSALYSRAIMTSGKNKSSAMARFHQASTSVLEALSPEKDSA